MRIRLAQVLLGGAVGACLFATSATAQIETVIVTAEKRSEDIQKVSVAVTALNGTQLESRGVLGFKELTTQVPSLRFGAGVTGGENVITMRGLGSQNTTPGGDSPVAYSVDGVYLQRTTAVDPEFYDVTVQVLRGPQGTLYGRNSVGGSVNVLSNKPDDTFGGEAEVGIGNYSANLVRAYLTGPIVKDGDFDILFRLTGEVANHDPYAINLSTKPGANHNADAQDFQMIRGQIQIDFNSDVNLLLTGSYNHNNDIAAPITAWWQTPTRYVGLGAPIALGSPCDFSTPALFDPRRYCHEAPEAASNAVKLFSGTLNWHLGWADFTSVTGYSDSAVSQMSDGDGSDAPIAFGASWVLRQHQISEEARLQSNDEAAALSWIAGFYYFWSDNFENFAYIDTGFNDVFPFPQVVDQFTFLSHGHTATRSYAPFGQLDFDLAKTSVGIPLTITAGLRYTRDTKYGTNFLDYRLPLICPPPGTCLLVPDLPFSKSWSSVTPRFALSYQANDNLLLYASASRGYLSGGNIIGLPSVYNPESLWSYEVGFKSTFWDDRARLNVAAYHEEITGLQVFIQSSTQSGINNVNGLTQVNGIESELTLEPVDNLLLNVTATFTSAHYGEYLTTDNRFGAPPPGCTFGAPPTLCNFKGNDLNQTPPYAISLGAQYTFDTEWGTITPRVDAYFSGEVNFLPDNLSPQKAYTQTNIHVTWESPSRQYKIMAFVNNLEDADVISNDGLQSITLGQQVLEPDNFVYYPPRTFGLRLAIKVGGAVP
jgi:iron complex outermembrane receptor protein